MNLDAKSQEDDGDEYSGASKPVGGFRATTLKHIGPGLLFAGAAVGVSHLVQSTRAGAEYGLSLIAFVLLINVLKYPSFRFAIDYSCATGHTLIQGYRQIGRLVPYIYLVVFGLAAPVFVAAVGITTAAILLGLLEIEASPVAASVGVLFVASVFLCVGNYQWLEKTNKVFVVILTVSTVIATMLAIPRIDWSLTEVFGTSTLASMDTELLLFLVALGGFMPNPLDISVAQSIWTLDAQRQSAEPSIDEARAAFGVGYTGSALLAICFLLMGAGLLHNSGVSPSSSSAAFASQLIEMYRVTLGPTLGVVAAVSALSVMITTVLAAMDVYGRGLTAAALSSKSPATRRQRKVVYRLVVIAVFLMAAIIQFRLYSNFRAFIDTATTIAFVTAPLIAILNFLCIRNASKETDLEVGWGLLAIHFLGIAIMLAMAVHFVVL